MIAAVRGTLQHKTLDSAFVTVGGVTLRVLTPLTTLAQLTTGQQVHLHTYLLVREDALTLFGFSADSDRDMFERLIAVGGVGPQTGLALLSNMSAATLRDTIVAEDVTRLSMARGVGKKLAARLVLELRPQMEKLSGLPVGPAGLPGASGGSPRGEVMDALTSLGYGASEAAAAVRSLPDDASGSLEDLIFQALRSLAKE